MHVCAKDDKDEDDDDAWGHSIALFVEHKDNRRVEMHVIDPSLACDSTHQGNMHLRLTRWLPGVAEVAVCDRDLRGKAKENLQNYFAPKDTERDEEREIPLSSCCSTNTLLHTPVRGGATGAPAVVLMCFRFGVRTPQLIMIQTADVCFQWSVADSIRCAMAHLWRVLSSPQDFEEFLLRLRGWNNGILRFRSGDRDGLWRHLRVLAEPHERQCEVVVGNTTAQRFCGKPCEAMTVFCMDGHVTQWWGLPAVITSR